MEERAAIEEYFDRLWPLLRSLNGEGVRRTHEILRELLPLETREIPSGTPVLDWTVPPEWVVREAYVVAPDGRRMLDVRENNVHLMGRSMPFCGRISLAELEKHLHSMPALPKAIPFVISYYAPNWGFSIAHEERERLPDGDYEVVIDTDLVEGSTTISEVVLPGELPDEVLLSTYTCHPSMANDNLSGPLIAAFLYRRLAALPRRRLTYRFAFVPETIGAIIYLSQRGDLLRERLRAGYVVTCAGDPGPFTYKRSRRGDCLADRAAELILRRRPGPPPRIRDFFPTGSDERQYCSPGFNLPVGSIMRSAYGDYAEYHTSLDNRDFVSFDALVESIDAYFEVCRALDTNVVYRNLFPFGEPQLGRRGLYSRLGAHGSEPVPIDVGALRWLLNLADGTNDLLAIAERSGYSPAALHEAAELAVEKGLLRSEGPQVA